MTQARQTEWHKQWSMFRDDEEFLFLDWIYPNKLDDFRDKDVLECGCGGGQHTAMIAKYARSVTAVDLNTADIAAARNKKLENVRFIEADVAQMKLKNEYDIVISIGAVHHTDNADKTVENLVEHLKTGGKLILWVYSKEGNILVRKIVEPIRKLILRRMNATALYYLSMATTVLMYIPIYSLYRLPLKFLPYYEYFENFRKLRFKRNTLNVFDKVNAPQVDFISLDRIEKWLNKDTFKDVHISHYKGVSWRGSGVKTK
jgi:SAM-dependent methyltransferase